MNGMVDGGSGGVIVRRNRKKGVGGGGRSREGTLHGVNRGPSFKASSVVQSDESTMFYITLNIEDVNGSGGNGQQDGSCKFQREATSSLLLSCL